MQSSPLPSQVQRVTASSLPSTTYFLREQDLALTQVWDPEVEEESRGLGPQVPRSCARAHRSETSSLSLGGAGEGLVT